MAVLSNTGIRAGASGAGGAAETGVVANSLRFNEGDAAHLTKTMDGGNRKTWTWSAWVKRWDIGNRSTLFSAGDGTSDTGWTAIEIESDNMLKVTGWNTAWKQTSRLFRDPSAWYHIVVAFDTTQSTATDRCKIWINGVQESAWNADNALGSDTAYAVNEDSKPLRVGGIDAGGVANTLSNFYLAEVHMVDGTALDASSFGETDETTGQWVPIEYTHSTSDWHTLNDGTTWSDYVSTSGGYANSPSNAFDGSTSTKCEPSDNSTVTFDFTGLSGGGIDVSSSLRIYLAKAGTPAASHFTVNGTNLGGSLPSGDWLTVSTSLLETITLYHQSGASSVELFAIEVDGFILIDDAADNSFHLKFDPAASSLNDGTTWSDDGDNTNINGSYPWTKAFDGTATGSYSDGAGAADAAGWARWTPSGGITVSSSLRVNTDNGTTSAVKVKFSGVTVQHLTSLTDGWNSVSGTGTLEYIEIYNSGSTWSYLCAVEVDGEVLVDDLKGALGVDSSGNINIWTPNNFSTTAGVGNDVLADSPTTYNDGGNGVGNYATLNPLAATGTLSLSNGNLDYTATSAANNECFSSIQLNGGKFYFEGNLIDADDVPGSTSFRFGIAKNLSGSNIIIYNATGDFETLGTTDTSPSSYTAGNTIGVAVDCVDGSIEFFKDGSSEGTKTFTVGTDVWTAYIRIYKGGGNDVNGTINFGQRAFAYTPPTGYKALNTFNTDTPLIDDPSEHFDTKKWDGNSSTQTISGYGFSPDFAWIKVRSEAARSHFLFDTIRGATNVLKSDATDIEQAYSTSLTAFNSDGFDLGAWANVNNNTKTIVGWAWNAGSEDPETNDAGSIDSEVKANPSAGFSIVKWDTLSTAETVGHGLNATAEFILMKTINTSGQWSVYHKDVGPSKYFDFTDDDPSTNSLMYTTAPTSSVFSPGDGVVNTSIYDEMIAYCWAPVEGYSKFGSWDGNNSSDGPFVHTNFRPAFLLWKRTDGNANWYIYDSSRSTVNVVNDNLEPNTPDAENILTSMNVDFTSNGFKIRGSDGDINGSGGTYVYAAFAESPFKYSNAR